MVEKYKLARKNRIKAEMTDRQNRSKFAETMENVKAQKTRTLLNMTVDDWVPKTKLGKMVKAGEIKDLDEIFDKNLPVLEPLIADYFIDSIQEKVIDTKKTSYVRMSGRKYGFRASVLIGDGNKFLGIGTAKDVDKWNAVRKAARKARLNIIRIKKGCGSWQCVCGAEHTVPKVVSGKCASVTVTLIPAPKGVGLVAANAIRPVFEFVGIKDVWSKTSGSTATTLNFIKATLDALSKTYN